MKVMGVKEDAVRRVLHGFDAMTVYSACRPWRCHHVRAGVPDSASVLVHSL